MQTLPKELWRDMLRLGVTPDKMPPPDLGAVEPVPADPTQDVALIDANPVWAAASVISDHFNPDHPRGWGAYIKCAEQVIEATAFIVDFGDD